MSMTLSDRINDLFEKFNVSLKVSESDVAKETLAELTLDNGTVIYTDAEAFSVGADAYIITKKASAFRCLTATTQLKAAVSAALELAR